MGFIDGTAAVVVTDSSARLAQLVHSDRTQLAALDVVGSSGLTYLRGLANVHSVCAKKTVYWRINLI